MQSLSPEERALAIASPVDAYLFEYRYLAMKDPQDDIELKRLRSLNPKILLLPEISIPLRTRKLTIFLKRLQHLHLVPRLRAKEIISLLISHLSSLLKNKLLQKPQPLTPTSSTCVTLLSTTLKPTSEYPQVLTLLLSVSLSLRTHLLSALHLRFLQLLLMTFISLPIMMPVVLRIISLPTVSRLSPLLTLLQSPIVFRLSRLINNNKVQ